MTQPLQVCLLGFGEVGQWLAGDLIARGFVKVRAWDIAFADERSAPSTAIASMDVRRARSAAEAATGAHLVISAVTAAQDLVAAESMAAHLSRECFYLDVNSVSPSMKQAVDALITQAGARYVEAAIMSAIAPRGIASPMLLGGPHAREFVEVGRRIGFVGAEVFADEIGRASAAKMCRSVVVKGMEALLTEALISARHYQVEDTVIESLKNVCATDDWYAMAYYMIGRSLVHGRRRAEEMREVSQTVREAGLSPAMSLATVERQEWAAQGRDAAHVESLEAMLDALLSRARAEAKSC